MEPAYVVMQTRPSASEGLALMRPPVSNAQRIRPVSTSTAKRRPSVAPKKAVSPATAGEDSTFAFVRISQTTLPLARVRAVTRAVLRAHDQLVARDRRGRGLRRVRDLPPDDLARRRVDRPRVAAEGVDVEDAVAVARRILDVLLEPAGPERLPGGDTEVDRRAREVAARPAAEHRPAALVDVRLGRRLRRGRRWRLGDGWWGRRDDRHVGDVGLERPPGSRGVATIATPAPRARTSAPARMRTSRRMRAAHRSASCQCACAIGPFRPSLQSLSRWRGAHLTTSCRAR